MPPDYNPARLRREMRRNRRTLSLSSQRNAALAARRLLAKEMTFLRARRIAAYMAMAGEMDPAPIMESGLAMKKKCYLPVMPRGLLPRTRSSLVFQRYDPESDTLAVNRFGVLEPAFNPHALISTRMLDLVLMPLVAFDRQGNRLGMGGGYYDKTFAGIREQWRRPVLLGIAYAMQEVDELDANSWDVRLDGILTEKEVIWSNRPG